MNGGGGVKAGVAAEFPGKCSFWNQPCAYIPSSHFQTLAPHSSLHFYAYEMQNPKTHHSFKSPERLAVQRNYRRATN